MRKLKNEELPRLDVASFKEAQKIPIVIVLDNIRSMNNVGSAFRTADAFLIEKILLCGITARPPHRDIHKTALGATDSVTWEYFETTSQAVNHLRNEGYEIAAIEQADESTFLDEFQPNPHKKYALIFGNEVFGVEDKIVQHSDIVLEIPQYGTKHSMNISVTIGVVLWDLSNKMKVIGGLS